MLNVVELYAGTGRSAEPFRRSRGFKVKLLVDSNEGARDNYLLNFPQAKYEVAHIGSRVNGKWLEERAGGQIDVLLGCPPCQGFSDVGSRDIGDHRNAQLAHFGRLAVETMPKMIAMENVPGAALSPQFKRLVTKLTSAGYAVEWDVLNSAHFGSAQSRHRLVLFAARGDLKTRPEIPVPTHGAGRYFSYMLGQIVDIAVDPVGILGVTPAAGKAVGAVPLSVVYGGRPMLTVGDALAGLPRCGTREAAELAHIPWKHGHGMLKRMGTVKEGGRYGDKGRYFSQAYGRLHRRGLARTITTYFNNPGSGRFWHPTSERALTLREAARIQGFPDEYRFAGVMSHDATLVGNALDSALAMLKCKVIRETLGD